MLICKQSDWSGRSSRLNSSAAAGGDNSLGSSRATTPVSTKEDRDSTENGEPDYKRVNLQFILINRLVSFDARWGHIKSNMLKNILSSVLHKIKLGLYLNNHTLYVLCLSEHRGSFHIKYRLEICKVICIFILPVIVLKL